MAFRRNFEIAGDNFANAGRVSTEIKAILRSVGYPNDLVRRLSIAIYEAEMNVVLYARRARLILELAQERVHVVVEDEGPGIPDIRMAMQEGYSTATDTMRERGFGAGLGLPNIQRNADVFEISSEVGRGTRLDFAVMLGTRSGRAR